jgi:hypothetical protein
MNHEPIRTRNDALEFARRTRRNLEFVEAAKKDPSVKVHVVTQLTVSLLGLVVFPKEKMLEIGTKTLDEMDVDGWPRWAITIDDPNRPTNTLADILRHLRNAIAHGRLMFTSDSENLDEVAIVVEDKRNKNDPSPYWRAQINGKDLRSFCFHFLDFIESSAG